MSVARPDIASPRARASLGAPTREPGRLTQRRSGSPSIGGPMGDSDPSGIPAGLCGSCRHARRVVTPRSVFLRCALSATDPRFERYPRLPMLACEGHAPLPDDPGVAREPSG